MGLKVIGAGFFCTGTLSMKHALEQLGFNECYHMIDFVNNPDHVDIVYPCYHGEQVDWDSVFTDKYQAAVDFPSFLFYKEMMEAYPDAKVVLTVRDPEKWYKSVRDTIYKVIKKEETGKQMFGKGTSKMREMVRGSIITDDFEDKEHMISVFNNHVEEVKRVVSADKLLVYRGKEGWEPLCKFLGVDIPDKPFPKANDRQAMERKLVAFQDGGM